jgi:hypothetical protein
MPPIVTPPTGPGRQPMSTDVPYFVSGSADQRTYLVAELPAGGQRMVVHLVRNNDVERKEKIADIPLIKGPTLSPLW